MTKEGAKRWMTKHHQDFLIKPGEYDCMKLADACAINYIGTTLNSKNTWLYDLAVEVAETMKQLPPYGVIANEDDVTKKYKLKKEKPIKPPKPEKPEEPEPEPGKPPKEKGK